MRTAVIAILAAAALAAVVVACGSGSSSQSGPQMGFVNTSFSDPATCQAPKGPYSNVYVTVADALAHTNPNAGANDSGWVDLTPSLKSKPMQVDLLALPPNNQCFLAMLGSQTQLPAGSYQQIRLILLANNQGSVLGNSNKCQGNDANCVVLAADGSKHTLQLSSEAQTGIKIPSGQLAGGKFTVAANDTVDLNIDINCCASIVITGNGQYRLKPVLHAGEVSAQSVTSISIRGKAVVMVNGTPQAISGGKTIVALEQVQQVDSTTSIGRVLLETTADAAGNFVFCPVPAGTYDVVIAAIDGSGVAYAATVTTGVQPGSDLGNVPMIATTGTNTGPATLSGRVTTSTGSAGAAADIQLSALQSISSGVFVTVPLAGQSSATASLETASGSCPTNTDCAGYTIQVPALNPNIGAFVSGSTTNYTQDTKSNVQYTVDALAFIVGSGGAPDCTQSEQKTPAITVTPGATPPVPDLVFTGCTP